MAAAGKINNRERVSKLERLGAVARKYEVE